MPGRLHLFQPGRRREPGRGCTAPAEQTQAPRAQPTSSARRTPTRHTEPNGGARRNNRSNRPARRRPGGQQPLGASTSATLRVPPRSATRRTPTRRRRHAPRPAPTAPRTTSPTATTVAASSRHRSSAARRPTSCARGSSAPSEQIVPGWRRTAATQYPARCTAAGTGPARRSHRARARRRRGPARQFYSINRVHRPIAHDAGADARMSAATRPILPSSSPARSPRLRPDFGGFETLDDRHDGRRSLHRPCRAASPHLSAAPAGAAPTAQAVHVLGLARPPP